MLCSRNTDDGRFERSNAYGFNRRLIYTNCMSAASIKNGMYWLLPIILHPLDDCAGESLEMGLVNDVRSLCPKLPVPV